MAQTYEVTPWTRRARSGVLLVLLSAALGAVAALVIGATIVLAGTFLDQAL